MQDYQLLSGDLGTLMPPGRRLTDKVCCLASAFSTHKSPPREREARAALWLLAVERQIYITTAQWGGSNIYFLYPLTLRKTVRHLHWNLIKYMSKFTRFLSTSIIGINRNIRKGSIYEYHRVCSWFILKEIVIFHLNRNCIPILNLFENFVLTNLKKYE